MTSEDTILTTDAPKPGGAYSQARRSGDLLWVTGQIGRYPDTGEFVPGGFEAQFNRAISNLEGILKAGGCTLADVVRTQVQFVDESDLEAMNRVYGERFPEPLPARSSFGVAFLWKGAKVQIDCVARIPKS